MSLRALVIGLDGATFDLLQPMVEQGWLPNLGRVLEQGAHGVLRSTTPPLTAPAWSSFLTGLTPGGHGVFSFGRRLGAGLQPEFVNGAAIHGPRLWQWLAQEGLTCGCINVPMTWPPQPMPPGSYLVSGMETPSSDSPFTDPAELASDLRAMGYVCDLRVKLHERDVGSPAGVTSVAHDLLHVLQRREAAIFKLFHERPTDVLTVVFETPDRLQHWAWRAIDELLAAKDAPQSRPATALHEAVETCYRELDRIVGRLLREATGPHTHVFLLSDHGFGPLHSRFHADQWLAEQGWLVYDAGKAALRQRLRQPLRAVKRLVPRPLLRRGRQALAVNRIIDWQHTQAYSGRTMEHAIYVNLRGREPCGVVAPEEYDRLRQKIREALLALRDPRVDQPLVSAAYLREDLYRGPYVEEAPDLLFELAPGYEPTSELSRQGILSDASAEGAGIHQPEGIFMLLGPGAPPGVRLPEQRIEDVLPTILYALRLPAPTALDGRIALAAFAPDYLAQHPPIVSDRRLAANGEDTVSRSGFTAEEALQVEQRLAALGYLG